MQGGDQPDGVEVAVDGARPDGLRLSLVDPGRDTAAAARAGADPGDEPTEEPTDEPTDEPGVEPTDPSGEPTSKAKVRAPQPDLRSRKDWGADESWRDGKPVLCRTIQQVHVHHTASGNDYSRKDEACCAATFVQPGFAPLARISPGLDQFTKPTNGAALTSQQNPIINALLGLGQNPAALIILTSVTLT